MVSGRSLFVAVALALVASSLAIPVDMAPKKEPVGAAEKALHDKFVSWKAEVPFCLLCPWLSIAFCSVVSVFGVITIDAMRGRESGRERCPTLLAEPD
eukprot:1004746-Rhodomonas_salina.3